MIAGSFRSIVAGLVAMVLPLAFSPSSDDSTDALCAVDRFFETFNSRDAALWASSLHYPHIRKPGVGRPIRSAVPAVTAEEYASRFDYERIILTGWHHTAVESKDLVHNSRDMAHVAALYHRYNQAGERIRTTRVTYLATKLGGSWGIQARFGAGEPFGSECERKGAESAALETVERYLAAFDGEDGAAWSATLRYPFVNVEVGNLIVVNTPEDAIRFDRSRLDPRFREGCLTWEATRVIQSGSYGVNVVAELRRTDSDGRQIAASSGLFLATNLHSGEWGVIGISVIPDYPSRVPCS